MALKRHLRNLRRRLEKSGRAPGAVLAPWHNTSANPAHIAVLSYDADACTLTPSCAPQDALGYANAHGTGWIRVTGIEDVESLTVLGQTLALHPLALEDIHHPDQRPKVDLYDSHLVITLRLLHVNGETEAQGPELVSEQLSLTLSESLLASFCEREAVLFNPIAKRLHDTQSFTRRQGPDYLAYRLMDAAVDQYFHCLEALGEALDVLSDTITQGTPNPEVMKRLQRLKGELMAFRRVAWPLREVVNALQRGDSPLITESTRVYLRDLQDHLTYVMDTLETYRDMLSGMFDLYLSQISFRINMQIKVMTVIATIFMPLSFIVGVYGMNFRHMPELSWPYGYAAVWGVMIVLSLAMVGWFRAKRWF